MNAVSHIVTVNCQGIIFPCERCLVKLTKN